MSCVMSLVFSRKVSRFCRLGAIGLSALLLSGCFAFDGQRRAVFDHAHYAPVGEQAEDIFIDPVGHVDRTIPNKLGRLDVKPANYSFETDKAARARAKFTLPPQPQIPAVPKARPKTGLEPNAQPTFGADTKPAVPSRPVQQRSPARAVSPGIEIAPSPTSQAQSQALPQPQPPAAGAPLVTDPVAGVVPQNAAPIDKSLSKPLDKPLDKPWAAIVAPTVPPKM
jgi:hypothetical protein